MDIYQALAHVLRGRKCFHGSTADGASGLQMVLHFLASLSDLREVIYKKPACHALLHCIAVQYSSAPNTHISHDMCAEK